MRANKFAVELVSELFKPRVIDNSAETCDEISAKTGRDVHLIRREIRRLVDAGRLEQVWKRGARQLIPAYRIKK